MNINKRFFGFAWQQGARVIRFGNQHYFLLLSWGGSFKRMTSIGCGPFTESVCW